jgi:hypothetical protein
MTEQYAHPSHLIGWRVLSDQSNKSKKNQKGTLAVGQGPSKSFRSGNGYYCKKMVLAYPDYSSVFEIYTDTSSNQLGAVITQDNRLIAFFSRKLSIAHHRYSVAKIELLAIVETLK